MWAEANTHDLLEGLIVKEKGKRAKWQIVHFLSALADRQIRLGATVAVPVQDELGQTTMKKVVPYYQLTTESDGAWHLTEYSKFLYDNIAHVEDEVVWLVDPDDFGKFLIPACIHYVLGSLAISKLKLHQAA